MKKFPFLLMFTLYSCTPDNTCLCTETITDIEANRVDINEFLIECDNPYTILETYRWGNIVIDCR